MKFVHLCRVLLAIELLNARYKEERRVYVGGNIGLLVYPLVLSARRRELFLDLISQDVEHTVMSVVASMKLSGCRNLAHESGFVFHHRVGKHPSAYIPRGADWHHEVRYPLQHRG